MKILVNKEEVEVDGSAMSYEEVVGKAVKGLVAAGAAFNVSYVGTTGQPRTMVPSERIFPEEGMRFAVRALL